MGFGQKLDEIASILQQHETAAPGHNLWKGSWVSPNRLRGERASIRHRLVKMADEISADLGFEEEF
jgi:hypothetical protein